MPASRELADAIRAAALALGCDAVGIASARDLPDPEPLRRWLAAGRHAGMRYLERHVETRLDPRRFLPGVESVVCVALNYYRYGSSEGSAATPAESAVAGAGQGRGVVAAASARPRVARYARGQDYHPILRAKLSALLRRIEAWAPLVRGRVAVDTAPVLERHWAQQAGLGWIGRNGCLIVPRLGSWVVLGELFLDLPLPADEREASRCGRCRRCHEACPTQAFAAPQSVDAEASVGAAASMDAAASVDAAASMDGAASLDARRCIAYWTIEHRGPFPAEPPGGVPPLSPWLFGCDVCQEVCPWNRFAVDSAGSAPRPEDDWLGWDADAWERLTPEEFTQRFGGTPLERAGYGGLRRNLDAWRGSQ